MRLTDFDYELPEDLIARHPARDRRGSRLLEVSERVADRRFDELPGLLESGDLLVFNDTRVIPARLHGRKATGGKVEILIERAETDAEALAHVRASKPPRPGTTIRLDGGVEIGVLGRSGDLYRLQFGMPVMRCLEEFGEVPLPPYIERPPEGADQERYQTVYAREPGAVAAPTAGLHFDAGMLEETAAMGVGHAWVTLHVGAGTFQSLREQDVKRNRLHSERADVSEDCCAAIRRTKEGGGRVVCVGTTVVRSLEAAAAGGQLQPFSGETDLFIYPGYRFRVVDAMLTNFHLPQSSLLMLVAAFAGRDRILAAYHHAVAERYRFFSYGDAMFLTPGSGP
jgi:S-adenosylmethionine:tRNA ribosyltransferase-isomerase